jgi:hypothetical protein
MNDGKKTRVWLEIGDMMINTDLIACVQRTGGPGSAKGCTFFLANGGHLNADGADYDQIKNLLGFSTDGEAPGGN